MAFGSQEAVQHKPFKDNACGTCHDPHASDYEGETIKPMPDLCYACHKNTEASLAGAASSHVPFEEGKCNACHSPHKSKIKQLLYTRPRELCLSCHEKIVTSTSKIGHLDMEKGDCLSCHKSHVSDNRGLSNSPDPALCVQCHTADTERTQSRHMRPLLKISRCLPCHQPHVTEKPGLLRDIKHNPFLKGDCKLCHV
jgi:predicted CXXCH cytochrome family protein